MTFDDIPAVLTASDVHRAMEWYRDKLGWEPVAVGGEPLAPESNSELLYDVGGGRFSIYYSPDAGSKKATAVRLVVTDFEGVHRRLLDNGVVFDEFPLDDLHEPKGTPYWDDGALVSPDGAKTAWFKDSEGNVWSIGTTWG